MLKKIAFIVLGGTILLTSCGEAEVKSDIKKTLNTDVKSSNEEKVEDLKKALEPLITDSTNASLLGLQPNNEDIANLFQESARKDVEKYIQRSFVHLKRTRLFIGDKRTEIEVFTKDTDFLKTEKEANFPDGYYEIADQFNRGRQVYVVNFKEPGKEIGKVPLHLLFYSNGRWVLFPRVYRAFRGRA